MKRISMLLALLLCLCIGTCVAEPLNTQPLYTYETDKNVRFLNYVDLLEVYKGGESSLMALNGTVLAGPYTRLTVKDAGSGYVIDARALEATVTVEAIGDAVEAVELPASGLLNLQGMVVIPAEYAYADPLSEHWGVGYTAARVAEGEDYDMWAVLSGVEGSVHAIFTRADIYNLDTGEMVASLTPDQYKRIGADGAYLMIADPDGNTVCYDGTFTDATEAYKASKYANSQPAGSKPAEPDSFYDSEVGKYGLAAADGTVIYPAEYSYIYVSSNYNGFPLYVFSLESEDGTEQYGIVSGDGRIIMEPNADIERMYFNPVDENHAIPCIEIGGESYYGLMDRDGNTVVPMEYEHVRISAGDEFAVCVKADDSMDIYCLTDGKTVVEGVAENDIYYYSMGQSVLVQLKEAENYVIYCSDGTVTEIPEGSSASAISGAKGLYYSFEDADWNSALIDCHGNVVLADHGYFAIAPSGSYLLARNSTIGKYELFELNWN